MKVNRRNATPPVASIRRTVKLPIILAAGTRKCGKWSHGICGRIPIPRYGYPTNQRCFSAFHIDQPNAIITRGDISDTVPLRIGGRSLQSWLAPALNVFHGETHGQSRRVSHLLVLGIHPACLVRQRPSVRVDAARGSNGSYGSCLVSHYIYRVFQWLKT